MVATQTTCVDEPLFIQGSRRHSYRREKKHADVHTSAPFNKGKRPARPHPADRSPLPHSARAQWVPSKADGTLLSPRDPGFINGGGTFLVGSSPTPTSTPTGVYDKLTGWWLNAFAPSAASQRNSSLPGLSFDSFADNFASQPFSDSPVGYFSQDNSNLAGQ